MWPFKRKKTESKSPQTGPQCPQCKSTNTGMVVHQSGGQPDFVKTWRGQRYITCRCFACGRDFYSNADGIGYETLNDDSIVDDEEALHDAEEELRRQVEEEDDRMYR